MDTKFNKIFCIGLHKTGTMSFHDFFRNLGIKSLHNCCWSSGEIPNPFLEKYLAFSDGGGQFWFDEYEFGKNHKVHLLDKYYPNSKFILNTRPLKSWVFSKLSHANWHEGIDLCPPKKVENNKQWTYKSIDVVQKWIINRYKYHSAVNKYFQDRPKDLLIIDITSNPTSVVTVIDFLELDKNICFVDKVGHFRKISNCLNVTSQYYISSKFPHRNRLFRRKTIKSRMLRKSSKDKLKLQEDFYTKVYKLAVSGISPSILNDC